MFMRAQTPFSLRSSSEWCASSDNFSTMPSSSSIRSCNNTVKILIISTVLCIIHVILYMVYYLSSLLRWITLDYFHYWSNPIHWIIDLREAKSGGLLPCGGNHEYAIRRGWKRAITWMVLKGERSTLLGENSRRRLHSVLLAVLTRFRSWLLTRFSSGCHTAASSSDVLSCLTDREREWRQCSADTWT